MRKLKDYFIGAMAMLMLIAVSTTAYAAYNRTLNVTYSDIKLQINGVNVTPKDAAGSVVEPFSYNGTTYLPVRAVAEALNCKVDWIQSSQTVVLTSNAIGGGTGGTGGTTTPPAGISYNLIDTIPPYSISSNGLGHWAGFTPSVAYYETKGTKGITMGGIEYKNSLYIGADRNGNYALFNLQGKYETVGGIVGWYRTGENKAATVTFYGDGSVLKTLTIEPDILPVTFSLNVVGVSQLKIEVVGSDSYDNVGFAELKVS